MDLVYSWLQCDVAFKFLSCRLLRCGSINANLKKQPIWAPCSHSIKFTCLLKRWHVVTQFNHVCNNLTKNVYDLLFWIPWKLNRLPFPSVYSLKSLLCSFVFQCSVTVAFQLSTVWLLVLIAFEIQKHCVLPLCFCLRWFITAQYSRKWKNHLVYIFIALCVVDRNVCMFIFIIFSSFFFYS